MTSQCPFGFGIGLLALIMFLMLPWNCEGVVPNNPQMPLDRKDMSMTFKYHEIQTPHSEKSFTCDWPRSGRGTFILDFSDQGLQCRAKQMFFGTSFFFRLARVVKAKVHMKFKPTLIANPIVKAVIDMAVIPEEVRIKKHPNWNEDGTNFFVESSGDPNTQELPDKKEFSRRIKTLFGRLTLSTEQIVLIKDSSDSSDNQASAGAVIRSLQPTNLNAQWLRRVKVQFDKPQTNNGMSFARFDKSKVVTDACHCDDCATNGDAVLNFDFARCKVSKVEKSLEANIEPTLEVTGWLVICEWRRKKSCKVYVAHSKGLYCPQSQLWDLEKMQSVKDVDEFEKRQVKHFTECTAMIIAV